MKMHMDDKTFQANLLDTQVMLTKDHTKWSFETLQDLVEGPLHNPKRMEEAIKVSRYIKKLMSFYHPFARRFSDLPKTKVRKLGSSVMAVMLIQRSLWRTRRSYLQANQRWVRLGCSLLNVLMASSDGIRFLQEDEFLGQLVKSFAQLDPVSFCCSHIHHPVVTLTSGVPAVQPDTHVRTDILQEKDAGNAHVGLF